MRVTIEHREQSTGLTGKHKDCYVDCKVEFNEEERAIVKARDLWADGFTVRTSTPLPSVTSIWGTGLMRFVGPIMIVAGVIWGLAGGGTPTGLLVFAGIGLIVYGWLRARNEDKRLATDEQRITIKQLLNNPSITVHAWNPAAAKGIEDDIRQSLVSLKEMIKGSAELQTKQTFEL